MFYMKFRFFLSLTAICIGVGAQASSAATAPATADPMTLLPANSRHTFAPVPKGGTVRIEYLRSQDDSRRFAKRQPADKKAKTITFEGAFIVVEASDKPDLTTDWKQLSYFDKPRAESGETNKLLRFRPDGSLALEIDYNSKDQYSREFYPDSSLASYELTIGNKLVAAFSINPNDKSISYFAGGNGDFIKSQDAKDDFTHDWYVNGDLYLSRIYKAGNIVQTRLIIPQSGELSINSEQEDLSLYDQNEFWFKTPNQPVRAQVNDYYINGKDGSLVKSNFVDDEVRKRIREMSGPRYRPFNPSPAFLQQLEEDYLSRRAGFLGDYAKILKDAGQTWQGLELKSVLTPPK